MSSTSVDFSQKKVKENIGERLRLAVTKLGFRSNVDFFDSTGFNKGTFYAIIKNNRKPNSSTQQQLSAVGISPYWLITGKGDMFTPEKRKELLDKDYASIQAAGEIDRTRKKKDAVRIQEAARKLMAHLVGDQTGEGPADIESVQLGEAELWDLILLGVAQLSDEKIPILIEILGRMKKAT